MRREHRKARVREMARRRRRAYEYVVGGFAGVLIEVGALVVLSITALLTALIVAWIL